jgi:hypothetical protein
MQFLRFLFFAIFAYGSADQISGWLCGSETSDLSVGIFCGFLAIFAALRLVGEDICCAIREKK